METKLLTKSELKELIMENIPGITINDDLMEYATSTDKMSCDFSEYFINYVFGASVEDILDNIRENVSTHEEIGNALRDYEIAKKYLNLRLERGDIYIPDNAIYADFLDLKLVVTLCIGKTSLLVKEEDYSRWNTTREEIIMFATFNNRKKESLLESISNILNEMKPEDVELEMIESLEYPIPMYVLTNTDKEYGADMIIRQDLLLEIHEKLGDFYVMPSSKHETILVPVTNDASEKKYYKKMIKDINANEVSESDFLSNSLYLFDGVLKIA